MRMLLALVLGLGGCAAGADGAPGVEWPYAEARADCAPWDGPATTIILSESPIGDSLPGAYLEISVYRSLTRVAGRTSIEGEPASTMSARMCQGNTPCIAADAGWVDLTEADSTLVGRYRLRLIDGRTLTGAISAPIRNRQTLCG